MDDSPCAHPEHDACGLTCQFRLRKGIRLHKVHREITEISSGFSLSNEISAGTKRGYNKDPPNPNSKRRRIGKTLCSPRANNAVEIVERCCYDSFADKSQSAIPWDRESANSTPYQSNATSCLKGSCYSLELNKSFSQYALPSTDVPVISKIEDHFGCNKSSVRVQPIAGIDSKASSNTQFGVNHVELSSPLDQLPLSIVPKVPKNSQSVEDCKRFFAETPYPSLVKAMKNWVSKTYDALDTSRTDEECWLHPKPPPLKPNGQAFGAIRRQFAWKDDGFQTLSVNFGIIALMVKGSLTNEQRLGYITEGWHLSHLCGNWTCLNSKHHTVEPGITNIKRNKCFRWSQGCAHRPHCLHQLKRRLLPGRKIVDSEKAVSGGLDVAQYRE